MCSYLLVYKVNISDMHNQEFFFTNIHHMEFKHKYKN
jgi:hypothetical protein